MTASADQDSGQPQVRHNDYGTLPVPRLGEWEPRLSVSVVIPAPGARKRLDLTLAALAGQSYPGHLMEVLIADDGDAPPPRLPEIVPERVRLVRGPTEGVDGDVILRLDAGMLVAREYVEAHLRWHHLTGYLVVLGHRSLADVTPPSPRAVLEAVGSGAADKLIDAAEITDKPDDLSRHGSESFRGYTGATASMTSGLLRAAGGVDDSFLAGADIELGYRLAQQGAVFVPDPEARAWHIGSATATRHNEPYLSHRLPLDRDRRRAAGRQWLVPCVDVVIDTRDGSYDAVSASVCAALASQLPDVGVTIVEDQMPDRRLIREAFVHDGRVQFVERLPATSAPAPFRFTCPPGWAPTLDGLHRLVELAQSKDFGAILLALPVDSDVVVARFERTAAVARAMAVRKDGDDLDDLIHDMYGIHWIDGTEWAMAPAADAPISAPGPEDAVKWKREAERWQTEAARLKEKLQAPLRKKLIDAGRRRISRFIH